MVSRANLFRDQRIVRQESLRAQNLLSCRLLETQCETLRSHPISLPSSSANTMIESAVKLVEPFCCESLSAQTTVINTFEAWDNCYRLRLQ